MPNSEVRQVHMNHFTQSTFTYPWQSILMGAHDTGPRMRWGDRGAFLVFYSKRKHKRLKLSANTTPYNASCKAHIFGRLFNLKYRMPTFHRLMR